MLHVMLGARMMLKRSNLVPFQLNSINFLDKYIFSSGFDELSLGELHEDLFCACIFMKMIDV